MAMTVEERVTNSPVDSVAAAIQGELKKIWTALPVIITTASDGHTAIGQSAINAQIVLDNGQITNPPMPPFQDAPVHYPNGGGHTFSHPVAEGDEGLMIFTARAQDAWYQQGGVQNPFDTGRVMHLADSRYIPGGRSIPRALSPPPSTSSAQVRADNGNHVVDVNQGSGVTHASTTKVQTTSGPSTSLTTPQGAIHNAPTVSINAPGVPNAPPGLTLCNGMQPTPLAPPAAGPLAGTISSMMASVLSGGASAVLSNPIAAATSSLSGAVSSGAAAVTSALGGAGATLVAAMTGSGGLGPTLSGPLTTSANNLSGVTVPGSGSFGLPDLMNHATMLNNYFGASQPPSVAFEAAAGPLQCGPTLGTMEGQVNSIVAEVLAGSMTVAAATAAIEAMTSTVGALPGASNTAISTLQTAAPALAMVAQAASAPFSINPAMAGLGALLAPPASPLATLSAAMLAVSAPTAGQLAALASFPDPSATQQGATGGVA